MFWLGGEGPRDISETVNLYLRTTLNVPLEKLTIDLRSVQKVGFWDGKLVNFIRIYNKFANEEASKVKDFNSLDQHPELILYEGYWEKDNNYMFMECKTRLKPQS